MCILTHGGLRVKHIGSLEGRLRLRIRCPVE